jgi:hypothetical protein
MPVPRIPRLDKVTVPEGEREKFARWLSGFTDGEGCFRLRIVQRKNGGGCRILAGQAEFAIKLRSDDKRVLQKIRNFWNCGVVKPVKRKKTRGEEKPCYIYTVANNHDPYGGGGCSTSAT